MAERSQASPAVPTFAAFSSGRALAARATLAAFTTLATLAWTVTATAGRASAGTPAAPGTIAAPGTAAAEDPTRMNDIAESYVKLVLAVGQHDANYVDAFYGPAEWKQAAEAAGKRPLPDLLAEARRLLAALPALPALAPLAPIAPLGALPVPGSVADAADELPR